MSTIKRLVDLIEKMSRKLHQSNSDKSIKLLEWTIKKIRLNRKVHLQTNKVIYRGEIYWCELGENIGSEESKRRPVVIIQNQKGNEKAPTTIIAPITNSSINLPIAVAIDRLSNSNITGTIDLGQIKVIHKSRLIGDSIDKLKNSELKKVDYALMKSIGTYQYVVHEQRKFKQKENYADHLNTLLKNLQLELGVNKKEDLLSAILSLKHK